MKKQNAIFFNTLLIIAVSLGLSSCGDDDGGGPSQPTVSGTFKATKTTPTAVDANWSLPLVTAGISEVFGSEFLTIIASNEESTESMTLFVPEVAEGQYVGVPGMAMSGFAAYTYHPDSFALSSDAAPLIEGSPGQEGVYVVNITSLNLTTMKVSGTFTLVMASPLYPANWAIFQEGEFTDVTIIDTSDPITNDGVMTASVGGQPFAADFALAVVTTFPGLSFTSITGSTDDGRTIGFMLSELAPAAIALNSPYALAGLGNPYTATYDNGQGATDPAAIANSTSGSITFTAVNTTTKILAGTFTFTAQPLLGGTAVTITNGAFSVNYN